MSLKEQLTNDMKEAMKAHDKDRLAVIRMVRGAVRQQEIDGKKELGDEDVLAVISKEVKMRRDSIEEFRKGGREDLVEKRKPRSLCSCRICRRSFLRRRFAVWFRRRLRRPARHRRRIWERSWASLCRR